MGLLNFKNKIEKASKLICDFVQSKSHEEEQVIFLRATRDKTGGYQLNGGTVSGAPLFLPFMITGAAKEDDSFAKAVIVASEALKTKIPKYKEFSERLNSENGNISEKRDGNQEESAMRKALREKFPDAEIMSIDATKLKDMPDDEFKQIVDKIFKASSNENNNPE